MKKLYRYDDSLESFWADKDELACLLKKQQRLLQNYEELAVEQADDEAYVARGNGFCDSKYSPEFLDGQIESMRLHIHQLQQWIDGTEL
ncbi:MAG: hypothetical protein MJZ51_05290 [Bacteroidales bacterium]|nr:hypothetical protein [Bacteroidales bacterium]